MAWPGPYPSHRSSQEDASPEAEVASEEEEAVAGRRMGQRRGEEGGEREEILGGRRGGRLQAVLLTLGSLRGRWCEEGGRPI